MPKAKIQGAQRVRPRRSHRRTAGDRAADRGGELLTGALRRCGALTPRSSRIPTAAAFEAVDQAGQHHRPERTLGQGRTPWGGGAGEHLPQDLAAGSRHDGRAECGLHALLRGAGPEAEIEVEGLLPGVQPVVSGLHQHGKVRFAVPGAEMLKDSRGPVRFSTICTAVAPEVVLTFWMYGDHRTTIASFRSPTPF
ncbi:hypothetical protein JJE72_06310 [Sinomonas sp. JC656]|uniref:Uncharacterized protein n=1 Tax=Sinomonas cellulolyticus TaxID=2801916 RepID=A0ABS1K0B4_9MICC|nr:MULTISPECIES: hypothetical protein [Sinomonas]MBL0705120.1 hypothetical protein [Sinomonas cellulolyticus]